ncbi:MGH1-like glycoside hydrolase domain-containing protein [Neorhodopirellula pilleata]|uniref:Mannosyl oligosaccharide glucosidase n=1 Tax=Neorhodopirellula pilleata TaxID=2714738 RepID=A0A5C6AVY2_9BACT|nr:glucosidase [Neorhodopirellula pilleata]TWU03226.1 Mannosyl oligosaccharide glucosidase [Neorhodopirellula pilleata]
MIPDVQLTAEYQRLAAEADRENNWKRWGPYLSERQWGTVREDYSEGGHSWSDFPHEHARSRAYRWGEDGLLGFTDRQCRLCFGLALWNGNDTILKERLFGLTGPEGNHGEDVKELYYYLDSTPTHSYAKAMYRYPQATYPYDELVRTNAERGLNDREYELLDTGIFAENRFFDVTATYAKADDNDLLIEIFVTNHGPDSHDITILPTLWFRNTWVWGCRHEGCTAKPLIQRVQSNSIPDVHLVHTRHDTLEPFQCRFENQPGSELVFTENETNLAKLFGGENYSAYTKDAFHRYVIDGQATAVNPKQHGTKASAIYRWRLQPGETKTVRLRLTATELLGDAHPDLNDDFNRVMDQRRREADEFYAAVIPVEATDQERMISRQAYAGLMWTKQFYHYIVADWLDGDHDVMTPPAARHAGRNKDWRHLYARDILSMPDKWEYPWFAAWDLAFHMIPAARIDPAFAKKQLMVLLREWYMHPNGQLPAYEFYFDDVNPPVHAWACLRVFQMEAETGHRDYKFLAQSFQRLLLNFTWWVNQVDGNGDNVFAGGFLGLDNIGVFDRSKGLPDGAELEQADGTAWMAFYSGTMMSMALELARHDRSYSDMASKFLDHFIRIVDAMNGGESGGLWDEEDGFYYDQLKIDGDTRSMKVKSLVGLLPLIAAEILDEDLLDDLPGFRNRLEWFLTNRHDLVKNITFCETTKVHRRMLISIPSKERLRRVLKVLLDENEFMSPYGIRSLSKAHQAEPFRISIRDQQHTVAYVPGESDSWMFGGNSNWRGPIWFPTSFLLIEALQRYHSFYGDELQVECPTGSGNMMNLREVAGELNRRLTNLFVCPEGGGSRPCLIGSGTQCDDVLWQNQVLFYEYFNGDTGEGLGASHQTGWTALIATCIEQLHGRVCHSVAGE